MRIPTAKGGRRYDAFITAQEIEHPSYGVLEPVARALLIELRSLEQPFQIPVVSISVREAMQLLGVTQRPVERAFQALEAHGWTERRMGAAGRRRVVLLKSPAMHPLRESPAAVGEADE